VKITRTQLRRVIKEYKDMLSKNHIDGQPWSGTLEDLAAVQGNTFAHGDVVDPKNYKSMVKAAQEFTHGKRKKMFEQKIRNIVQREKLNFLIENGLTDVIGMLHDQIDDDQKAELASSLLGDVESGDITQMIGDTIEQNPDILGDTIEQNPDAFGGVLDDPKAADVIMGQVSADGDMASMLGDMLGLGTEPGAEAPPEETTPEEEALVVDAGALTPFLKSLG